MRRREFITIVGAAAAGWPFAAHAQRTGKMYRIGILLPNTSAIVARNPRIQAFLQGLQDLGWIDGQHVTLDGDMARDSLSGWPHWLQTWRISRSISSSRRRQPQPAPQNRQPARSEAERAKIFNGNARALYKL